jgi:hypothetical protein
MVEYRLQEKAEKTAEAKRESLTFVTGRRESDRQTERESEERRA